MDHGIRTGWAFKIDERLVVYGRFCKSAEEAGSWYAGDVDVTLEGCTPCPEASLGRRLRK